MEPKSEFHSKDDCGILEGGQQAPYFGIKLTKEQLRLCKGRVPHIYEASGLKLFKIKKEDGTIAEEEMIFVVFI